MKEKIDSVIGKVIYAKRIATAEPPFAHIRIVMGLRRFTPAGQSEGQQPMAPLLYCAQSQKDLQIWKSYTSCIGNGNRTV